jgi:para-nitrobenzyl esterase
MFKDGTVIHEAGYPDAIIDGDYNQVPIILGSNKEEQKLFMIYDLYGPPPYNFSAPLMDPCTYQEEAEDDSDSFWKQYSTDIIAYLLTLHQPDDVYAYQFLYGAYHYDQNQDCASIGFNAWPDFSYIVGQVNYGGPNYALWFGSLHSLDIPFFFGTYYFLNDNLTDAIFNDAYSGWLYLSDAMINYVAEFAYAGAPGDAGGEEWEPWSTFTGPRILLDADEDEAIIEMSAL